MKTVVRRANARRWTPYQGADILREFAKAIRELDSEDLFDEDEEEEYDDASEYNSDASSNSGWDSETESCNSPA